MRGSGLRFRLGLFACAAVMSSALGCSDDVVETPSTSSDVTRVCTSVQSGAPWWNWYFPVQSGVFHVEFMATPSANNIDAVVGLSNGTASSWTKLATIVRFSPTGVIDVRKGSAYAADIYAPYYAGQSYQFRVDVDTNRHVYSVYLIRPGYVTQTLAKNYAFRTEQASVTSLNAVASYLEPSRAGNLEVCSIRVVKDDSFGDNCIASDAGGTFKNITLVQSQNVLMTRFDATPSTANMDGVIGFGFGLIDNYNKFAASVRFATNGMIEARDGDAYRADQAFTYRPGTKYHFQFIIDVPSKTYSVRVAQDPSWEYMEIARSYKFRPQQANILAFDRAATIVASPTGHVDACGLSNQTWDGLKFAHRDHARVLPLHNNNLAMTDQTGTWITNADGATLYRGAPSGVVAHDNNDNLYIATTSNGSLKVESFTSTLAPRYTRTYQIDGDPYAINIWNEGTIAVALPTALVTLRPDGSGGAINLMQFTNPRVAISNFGWGLVQIFADGIQIDSFTTTGERIFQRFFSGPMSVDHFVPRAQAFVLAGQFYNTVDFGQGPMEPASNPDTTKNTYLLSLTANGVVAFSQRLWVSHPTGLATDGNNYIAVTTQDFTQTPYYGFTVMDSGGNTLFGRGGTGDETMGFAGGIAISASGRAFVNLSPKWYPGAGENAWSHLFAFEAN
jgi:hypothetical protein